MSRIGFILHNLNNLTLCNSFHSQILSNNLFKRNLKTIVPMIKWVRPDKIHCVHPKRSGDCEKIITPDKKDVVPDFKESNELKSADETVKKLFSLQFWPNSKTVATQRQFYVDLVKRHELDTDSWEVKIARMTATIRDMQEKVKIFPHNRVLVYRLKLLIDKRKKFLKQLRGHDYKLFEWLLEKLNLEYKPQPGIDVWMRVERKRSMKMLTKEYCDKLIQDNIDKHRASLEAQQEQFLIDKIENLKWIMKEEIDCGLKPTVTADHVNEAKKQLEEWRKNHPDVSDESESGQIDRKLSFTS